MSNATAQVIKSILSNPNDGNSALYLVEYHAGINPWIKEVPTPFQSVNFPPNLGMAFTSTTQLSKSIPKKLSSLLNCAEPLSPAIIGGVFGSSITVILLSGNISFKNNAVIHPALPPPKIIISLVIIA
jgi:hypothetical protein